MKLVRVLEDSFLTEGHPTRRRVPQTDKSFTEVPEPYGRVYTPGEELEVPDDFELGPNLELIEDGLSNPEPEPVRKPSRATPKK